MFGLLPLEFRPSGLGKWFGRLAFRVHADHLVIARSGEPERAIPFSRIISCEAIGDTVHLQLCKPDELLRLRGSFDPVALAQLLSTLSTEDNKRRSYRLRMPDPADAINLFAEMLGWRGTPFVDAMNLLLDLATCLGASDMHLEPGPVSVRITMRIRGELTTVGNYPIASHTGLAARLKHLGGCRSHLSGIPQEGAFSREFLPSSTGADTAAFSSSAHASSPPVNTTDVRLSIFPSLHGDRIAMRFIRPIEFPDLDALGWGSGSTTAWRNLLADGSGLILIVGPIGCGKTTALYASLAETARSRDGSSRRVATLEDPVEGRVPGICQASLDPRTGLGLADAFKHLLRQDPDIMALGEIRDPACLREALQGGLAGHLVLATFHAADPDGAMQRIMQMGLESSIIGPGLRGMLVLSLTREKVSRDNQTDHLSLLSGGRLRPTARVFRIVGHGREGFPQFQEQTWGDENVRPCLPTSDFATPRVDKT
ncbi:MAG: Flp pilus assembly complex ATPase component TadA [Candidatus Riflebacteria bacterium]|nr:Flp pilus assembly complex ATPase component TadA [Candidatus Riflebacteria bacterium]